MTYYAFLSFFPILAVAFFLVGYVVQVLPNAQDNLVTALETVLPGLMGGSPSRSRSRRSSDAAATVGLIGLVVLVYSGLGWISCMRDALYQVFQEPIARPKLVLGRRPTWWAGVIGLILIVSVAISGLVTGFSREFLDLLDLDQGLAPELALLGSDPRWRRRHAALLRHLYAAGPTSAAASVRSGPVRCSGQ